MRSKFIRHLFVLLISIAICNRVSAQDASRIYVEPSGWSIGMNVGMSDLWGNVGTSSVISHYTNSKYFNQVAFMGGLFGRYTIHPCLAIRLMMDYGKLYATDQWNYDAAKTATSEGADAYQRLIRNQDAKDNVFESSFLFEFSPFRMNPESKAAHRRGQLYIAAGVCYFHYTPYSTVANSNTWVNTYNLDLEGQGWGKGYPPQYKLWSYGIPLAIGYRWDVARHLNLGVEWMFRKTFTSYLDGVSGKYVGALAYQEHLSPAAAIIAQEVADKTIYGNYAQVFSQPAGNLRGNSAFKDCYSTIGITLYYKVAKKTAEWWH